MRGDLGLGPCVHHRLFSALRGSKVSVACRSPCAFLPSTGWLSAKPESVASADYRGNLLNPSVSPSAALRVWAPQPGVEGCSAAHRLHPPRTPPLLQRTGFNNVAGK